ncbi:MAG: hypothetical protein K0S07_1656 [Chlamydiales bacterium]|jgi:hypothetical protein|nr:hypothetical protein [Chlamydiales bacterium]
MRHRLLLLLFILPFISPLQADPWGKDSDLISPSPKRNEPKNLSYQLAKKVIRFHQEWLSPTDGPRSHFYPSSSQYMLNAIEKHGLPLGFCLGCDRLMRENDEKWLYPTIILKGGNRLKLDPVP